MFGFISSAFSAVCSVVTSIGSAVVSFARDYAPRIVETIANISSAINAIATSVTRVLGILLPHENMEETGERALQAADQGIRPENFQKFDDYMNELRNFELDPEKASKRAPLEKLMAGLAVTSVGLEQKLNMPPGTGGDVWLLAASRPEYFTADRLITLLQSPDHIQKIGFFLGKLGIAEDSRTCETLINETHALRPESNKQDIYAELMQARQAVQNLNQGHAS